MNIIRVQRRKTKQHIFYRDQEWFFQTDDGLYWYEIKFSRKKQFSSFLCLSMCSVLVFESNVDILVGMYIDKRVFVRLCILDRPLRHDPVVSFFFLLHINMRSNNSVSPASFSLSLSLTIVVRAWSINTRSSPFYFHRKW